MEKDLNKHELLKEFKILNEHLTYVNNKIKLGWKTYLGANIYQYKLEIEKELYHILKLIN